jgi:hypothetical protein
MVMRRPVREKPYSHGDESEATIVKFRAMNQMHCFPQIRRRGIAHIAAPGERPTLKRFGVAPPIAEPRPPTAFSG